jgi:predicted transcriptional regulator
MTKEVVTADPGMSLQAVATVMVQHHIHRVFVVEHNRPIGVVSTRDLMRAIVQARVADPIKRWMSSPVITIPAQSSIGEAADLLQEARVRGLVVEDQEWPVGLFTQTEVLLSAKREASTPVEDVMSCALLCLPLNMPLFRATALALETRARRILATAQREIHGILSGLDMARVVAASPGP